MPDALDLTESLVDRTKKLLADRGSDLPLRVIAGDTGLSEHWLRSFSSGRAGNPGVKRLEQLQGYLLEYHAARRFQKRQAEARAQ